MCFVIIHLLNTVARTWIHPIVHIIVAVVVVLLPILTLCACCTLTVVLFSLVPNPGRTSIHTVRLHHPLNYQRDAQNGHGIIC